MINYLRAYPDLREQTLDDEAGPIRFVASTEGVKADGQNLLADKWILTRYEKHPVVLYAHDFLGKNLPIGTGQAAIENRTLMIDVIFDSEDDFAMKVRRKTVKGMMGGSVSWNPSKEGNELLEFSVVPVPLDPDALPARQQRSYQDWLDWAVEIAERTHERGAIPPHTTEKADEGAAWDGPGEVAKCPAERGPLRRMHAWVDDEGDPDAKQSYKLPHHLAESGQVVWRGVAAAMARLLQAGTQIPDGDRRGVYNHLARHYKQFDKEAPEFRTLEELEALGEEEIRGLFLEGEWELAGVTFSGITSRKGAVLSSRNKGDLEQAISLIQGVLERAKKEEQPDEEGRGTTHPYEEDELAALQALNIRLALIGGSKRNG